MALPLNKGFSDTIAAPSANADTVKLAPPAQPVPSRHEQASDELEDGMVGSMQELRVVVVTRNQAFQEQLDVILARRDAAHSRLVDAIIPERQARMLAQRTELEAALRSLEADLSARIEATFSAHNDSLRRPAARLDADLAAEETFYFTELPAKNERQCGDAIRTMKAEREALDMDNKTIRAREAKIVARLDAHIARYTRRAEDETDDRKAQHAAYEKLCADSLSIWDTSAARVHREVPVELSSLQSAVRAEAEARRAADLRAVGAIQAAMERLRKEAIKNFGEEEDDEEDEEDE